MRLLHLVPSKTNFDFMRWHRLCLLLSLVFLVVVIGSLSTRGLNFGVDFKGGILIEMRTPEKPDFAALRDKLGALGVGEISLQGYDESNDVLLRLEAQENGEKGNLRATQLVREAMGPNVEFRRVETVGPTVGEELRRAGFWAVIASIVAILTYVSFRFEWQFGVGAIFALLHDVLAIVGLFTLLGLEFDLTTLAAILTIGGYSINDTVVVYDRIRENLRKYKRMDMRELINRSLNDTLQRTVSTGMTVILALIALLIFGGPVIRNFNIAMLIGTLVGVYSSIFIAAPVLIYLKVRRGASGKEEAATVKP
jgi:preprotein translocase subunit SecF